jgi:hypothetical protein
MGKFVGVFILNLVINFGKTPRGLLDRGVECFHEALSTGYEKKQRENDGTEFVDLAIKNVEILLHYFFIVIKKKMQ